MKQNTYTYTYTTQSTDKHLSIEEAKHILRCKPYCFSDDKMKNLSYAKNKYGCTQLQSAVKNNRKEEVHLLIAANVNVNTYNNNQQIALHYAAIYGDASLVMILVAAGSNVNAKDKYGQTPMHLAAWWGEPQIVAALLKCNAIVDDETLEVVQGIEIWMEREIWLRKKIKCAKLLGGNIPYAEERLQRLATSHIN